MQFWEKFALHSSNSIRLRLVQFFCCRAIFSQIALSSMRLPIRIVETISQINLYARSVENPCSQSRPIDASLAKFGNIVQVSCLIKPCVVTEDRLLFAGSTLLKYFEFLFCQIKTQSHDEDHNVVRTSSMLTPYDD